MVVWIDNITSFFFFPKPNGSLVSLGSVFQKMCRQFFVFALIQLGGKEYRKIFGLVGS